MKTFNDIKGVSALTSLLILFSLLAMGLVIAHIVAKGELSRANFLLTKKAEYVSLAGMEYGVKRIYDGQSEIVAPPGVTFGPGSFTISRSGRTLTVTGTVGEAVRVHKLDSPTQADCTEMDASNAKFHNNGKRLSDINFRKLCLTQIIVDKMRISWVPNAGQRITKIKIASTVYDNPAGTPSGTLLETVDYTATGGQNHVINAIDFNSALDENNNTTFTLEFILGDGTSKTATFTVEEWEN